ncbi:MAG: DedA family protein [Deferribacteres bacterium]|nr:DedA family protein [candidate division KSB1 bacterium]MCB9501397.1 DedA family protein [Deferribacteres bacterium]
MKRNFARKSYDWVLSWADTRYGAFALMLIAFAESSFFPIPPDILLIALVLGARTRAFIFAGICTFSSIIGAVFGYLIGYFIWWSSPGEFSSFAAIFFNHVPGFTETLFYKIKDMYDTWNFWVIFTAGFTPIPYKIFTVSAGAFNINFPMFIIASIVSRGARFFLVAGLLWKYGETIKNFIDKYFNLLAFVFTFLLIGGFLIIKFVFQN